MKRLLAILALVVLPLASLAQAFRAEFNPNILIPDASFADTKTFGGPEGIQRFLESKGSVLANTSVDFLARLKEPADSALKAALSDPEPSLGRLRTAAELIWDASLSSGLNPQVILVTLHKEQGLVGQVSGDRLQRALDHAMGFDCPDSSGCGNLFPGFYFQIFGNVDTEGNRYLGAAKSLMKSFMVPEGRGPLLAGASARVGDTLSIGNTLGGYDGIAASQSVTLGNRATAALYRYTPHVFNGNYNFWSFFTSWFRYPNGTLLRSTASATVYIVSDGQLKRIPNFVAISRGLKLNQALGASETELSAYPTGATYAPADDTLVSVGGVMFVFHDGVRHPVSSFVLTQRKLNPALIMPITEGDAAPFPPGTQLAPSDGSILRGVDETATYRVDQGVLKRFSDFTLKQFGAAKLVQPVPAGEIALYPKAGYVAPKDGTLVKAPGITGDYVMSASRRLPLTAELFANNQYKTKNVVTLGAEEISSIPVGPIATPREGTWFSVDGQIYLFKNGTKHPVFAFVAKQRAVKPDFGFEPSIASAWADGIAIPPKDGTLLRSVSATTTYVVANGQLRPIADEIFKLWRYRVKSVVTLADAEIEAFAKGVSAEPPERTYFTSGGATYLFKTGEKHRIFAFVAKQRGLTADVALGAETAEWTEGAPIPPRDGTLVKGDASAATYLTVVGVLRPIPSAVFKKRGYKTKNILTVPQVALDAFAKGAALTK